MLGLAIIAGCEFVLQDSGLEAQRRTRCSFYNQAWPLLVIAAAVLPTRVADESIPPAPRRAP